MVSMVSQSSSASEPGVAQAQAQNIVRATQLRRFWRAGASG